MAAFIIHPKEPEVLRPGRKPREMRALLTEAREMSAMGPRAAMMSSVVMITTAGPNLSAGV